MLRPARARGLHVVQGSLTDVPLPSASFDLVYSMKVLAHVPPIERAVAELARLVRPGGHLLLEFYNPLSLRYLAKRLGGPGKIAGDGTTEKRRLHPLRYAVARARATCRRTSSWSRVRGVRVVTPTLARVRATRRSGACSAGPSAPPATLPLLRNLGGFLILVAQKRADAAAMSPRLDCRPAASSSPTTPHDPLPYYYHPWVGWLYRHRLQMGLDFLPAGGRRVLEVGVGSGVLVPTLTKHYAEYTGTDLTLAPGLDALVAPGCRAEFRRADLLADGDLPAAHYDAIVCFSVLEHIADADGAARGLAARWRPAARWSTGYPMVSRAHDPRLRR